MADKPSLEEIRQTLEQMGRQAKIASRALAVLSPEQKNECLCAMADAVEAAEKEILSANAMDLDNAVKSGLSPALIDRLTLNPARIRAMAEGLRTVASQHDPVGRVLSETTRPNGLKITKLSVPMGVIAILFEARPNVTVDAAGICLKAGNAVILRGGKEAFFSNQCLAAILNRSAVASRLPDGAVQLVPWTTHDAVPILLKLDRFIDLVIPRGGERLIRLVCAESTIPVLKHYKGVCHLYVDHTADFDRALDVIENAKCSRPGTCNTLETLLIERAAAPEFVPRIAARLRGRGVELRGDETFRLYDPEAKAATEEDWNTEYLALILSVRIVDGVQAAIDHVNTYGSRHSDGILSRDEAAVNAFLAEVDSATVYVNASTRFTDGGEFGMGAEIGISTDKLHARGPMGADELTTYKYLVRGSGQIRV